VNYDSLKSVLDEALAQASTGKGNERHAAGRDFEDQPICVIPKLLLDDEGVALLYQAIKKLQESLRLPPPMRRAERLGAINYIAASLLLPGCQLESTEEPFKSAISRGAAATDVRQCRCDPCESLRRRTDHRDCPQCQREEGTGHKMDCTDPSNENQTRTLPAEVLPAVERPVPDVDPEPSKWTPTEAARPCCEADPSLPEAVLRNTRPIPPARPEGSRRRDDPPPRPCVPLKKASPTDAKDYSS
jgi:hypothetical protein